MQKSLMIRKRRLSACYSKGRKNFKGKTACSRKPNVLRVKKEKVDGLATRILSVDLKKGFQ